MSTDATQFRREFWTCYADLYPDDGVPSGWGRSHARVTVESADLNISLAVLGWGVGVWIRGHQGELPGKAAVRLGPFQESFRNILSDTFNGRLANSPGTEWISAPGGFDASREFEVADPENWPHMAAWLHYMLQIYLRVIEKAMATRG